MARWSYALAAAGLLLSLGAASYSAAMQIEYNRVLAATRSSQIVPLPAGALPAGSKAPASRPLEATSRQAITQLVWRDPLNPRLANLLYVDAVQTAGSTTQARQAAFLSQLGWRFTPAQQNLMVRAALMGNYDQVLDRVDALLRRQKLPGPAYAALNAMEALPDAQGKLIARLQGQPLWRRDYLAVIGSQSPPALLDGRLRTLRTLLATPTGMSREEMAPSLIALDATGRSRAAHQLWLRRAGLPGSDLLYDPDFRQASAVAGTSDTVTPFEWRLGQGLGYSTTPSLEGVMISWDHRGVPIFLSQRVPLAPGRQYVLAVRAHSDTGEAQPLLMPALTCGVVSVSPTGVDVRGEESRYRFGPLPPACDMATLTLGGRLDSGTATTTMTVKRVALLPG